MSLCEEIFVMNVNERGFMKRHILVIIALFTISVKAAENFLFVENTGQRDFDLIINGNKLYFPKGSTGHPTKVTTPLDKIDTIIIQGRIPLLSKPQSLTQEFKQAKSKYKNLHLRLEGGKDLSEGTGPWDVKFLPYRSGK